MRVWMLFFVFMMGSVLGVEGVSPGSYTIDFEAGLERDFVFDFVLEGEETLQVLGEFSKYAVLDKESFFGGEVVVSLKLPESVEDYGVNNIWILAGDVAGIVKINVAYPEKYIELGLSIPDVNVGEEVSVKLKIYNFGNKGLLVSPVIDVYFGERLVETFEGDEKFVEAFEIREYDFSLDSVNYSGGNYFAVARVDDGEEVVETKDSFRLGEFEIKILDYTHEVIGGGIEKFEIEIESLYDDEIREVHAEVRAEGRIGFEGFDSSIVSLSGWQKKTLVGYIDTRNLEGRVLLNIDVYYNGKVESKLASVYIEKKSYLVFWIAGFLLFVVVGFFVWKFFKK